MGIDFHSYDNRRSYASRKADADWLSAIRELVNPAGLTVVDAGCGGGIYTEAWAELGARRVIGVDFSEAMLAMARENTSHREEIVYVCADATQTGLPAESADLVFARALVHHLQSPQDFLAEAYRLLVPGGICLVQNRTMEDVSLPGSPDHLRGYFFEAFPRLLHVEENRRPREKELRTQMEQTGFAQVRTVRLWEVRKTYAAWEELEADLLSRMGRSLLHELSDAELGELTAYVKERVDGGQPIREQDRWTLWMGVKGNVAEL